MNIRTWWNLPQIRLQVLVLLVGMALMAVKFGAFLLTGSNAILTDAVESIANLAAGLFGLYSLSLAARPRDWNHPYGHGKIEFLSAGVEGGLIAVAGLAMLGKAVYNLLFPVTLQALDLGILLTLLAGLVNGMLGWLLRREGLRSQSPTLRAGGAHLISDALSSAGLVLGLGLVLVSGKAWVDQVLTLLFGGAILYTGIGLLRQALAGMMDEADPSLLGNFVTELEAIRKPQWIDLHNLRIIKYGTDRHIDAHMTLPWYLKVEEAHREVKAVEDWSQAFFQSDTEIFIHVDPCQPASCPICSVPACPVRQAAFEQRVPWQIGRAHV
jgi:cation diffusion facilitator family transporter